MNMNEQDSLIADTGKVQDALAKVLPQNTQYYVDAMKNEDFGSELFSYEDTVISELPLYHNTSSSKGNCLTYSRSGSTLHSAGEDCESKLMPLCFREIGASDLDFINAQCGNCEDFSRTPNCNKWEKLEDAYKPGDPFKVIEGLEICTDMCGPKVRRDEEYCSVSFAILISVFLPEIVFALRILAENCSTIMI